MIEYRMLLTGGASPSGTGVPYLIFEARLRSDTDNLRSKFSVAVNGTKAAEIRSLRTDGCIGPQI